MATFEKKPNGKWLAKVRRRGVTKSATFPRKAEAEMWANMIEAEINARIIGKIPDKPFSELINRYIETECPKKRGADKEVLRLRRLIGIGKNKQGIPHKPMKLASVRLPDLGPEHIAEWRDARLKTVSSASVLREWNTLSHVCTVAVKEWRWLKSNPMVDVRKPEAPQPRSRRPSKEEIQRILEASGYSADSGYVDTATARTGAAFKFAIKTAMRAGEIAGLEWKFINFNSRLAYLPKTKNNHPRYVPLSEEAIKILQHLQAIRDDTDSVFHLSAALIDALFRKIKRKCAIEDLHFHDSRREALTLMAPKVPSMLLSKISGHRDTNILNNTYYAPDMSAIAALLDAKIPGQE